jgi:Heliorhodopsin
MKTGSQKAVKAPGRQTGDQMMRSNKVAAVAEGMTTQRLSTLRKWNVALSFIHLAQAIALVVLSGTFAIAVTSSFPEGPPGSPVPAPETLFHLRIGWAIGAFLLLAAIDHALTATVLRELYERDLRRGINRVRWVEYSVSATVMIVLLTLYSGTTNVNALIAVIGANVAMILFGWLQERMNPPGRATTTMLPFWFGTIAGVAPWISIFINLVGSKTVPGFVYGIVVTEAIFFFSFALNQWLQYQRKGKWTSYEFGEKTYLVLSLLAKSLLAWQIFGGSLAGG